MEAIANEQHPPGARVESAPAQARRRKIGAIMIVGTITVAAIASLVLAYMQAGGWAEIEIKAAVSEAEANEQGTGSLASLNRLGAGLVMMAVSPWIPLIGGAIVGASPGIRQDRGLIGLVVAVMLATMLGFAMVVGLGGTDLLHADHLQDVFIPSRLVGSVEPEASPMASIGGVAIQLVVVSVSAMLGYGFGRVLRPKPRMPKVSAAAP